ncbi:hypothetical protein BHM03_00012451 [Ensete ventricosum]|nr:hypothetical protein BHM03_00012451 [Ensete ventricosum]
MGNCVAYARARVIVTFNDERGGAPLSVVASSEEKRRLKTNICRDASQCNEREPHSGRSIVYRSMGLPSCYLGVDSRCQMAYLNRGMSRVVVGDNDTRTADEAKRWIRLVVISFGARRIKVRGSYSSARLVFLSVSF